MIIDKTSTHPGKAFGIAGAQLPNPAKRRLRERLRKLTRSMSDFAKSILCLGTEPTILHRPLIPQDKLQAIFRDIDAGNAGDTTGIVHSDDWYLLIAEMNRQQIKRNLEITRSLAIGTWILAVFTLAVAVATILH